MSTARQGVARQRHRSWRLGACALLLCSTWFLTAANAATQSLDHPMLDSVTLVRTACVGICPIYRITVFSNDTFIYRGSDYVDATGLRHGRLPPGSYAKIGATLAAYSFDTFRQSYFGPEVCRENWTHHPNVGIILETAGRTRIVVHDHGCRGFDRETELIELQEKLDVLMQTERWVGRRPEPAD